MTSTPASASLRTFARASSTPVDAPAKLLGARIRLVLDERTRDVDRRALQRALVEAVADADRRLERRAEIARAGHAGQQELLGRSGHDDSLELGQIRLVPVRVVAVPVQHQMHVHVPQAGQHAHAFGGDHLGAARHRQRADGADRADPLALDEDHAVA